MAEHTPPPIFNTAQIPPSPQPSPEPPKFQLSAPPPNIQGPNKIPHKKLSRTLTNFRSSSTGNINPSNFNSSIGRKNISVSKLRVTATHQANRNGKKGEDSPDGKDKEKSKSQIKIKQSSGTNRSRSSLSPSLRKTPSPLTLSSKKSIPQQILSYIALRQDVQIVTHFESYKKQFHTKSKLLHTYIHSCEQPQKIKNSYLNESDSHFRNGLEAVMLKLYRDGTIVPQSWNNLRQAAVEEIQKWVIGWVHRKILYGKLAEDQENRVLIVQEAVRDMDEYRRQIQREDTSF